MSSSRVGLGYDLHRLVEDRKLILGGVEIPYERGLLGHSDADVVLHAITDALLGATGQGDIGELFPDDDPAWKGADSKELLREVMRRVQAEGWRVVNCDLNILAQKPKLKDHKPAIRACVATLLEVEASRVNIKAKTREGLDAVGRAEAIEVHTVVLIERR
jgi:2-C-methyl-D-erythritol 2,4-cyclodiphosphate synthase